MLRIKRLSLTYTCCCNYYNRPLITGSHLHCRQYCRSVSQCAPEKHHSASLVCCCCCGSRHHRQHKEAYLSTPLPTPNNTVQVLSALRFTNTPRALHHRFQRRLSMMSAASLLLNSQRAVSTISTGTNRHLEGADGDAMPIPSSTMLTIGDASVEIPDYSLRPERVAWTMPGGDHSLEPLLEHYASATAREASLMQPPENMFFSLQDKHTRAYLRWMIQKEALGQDMCLIGCPGPAMRWLVLLYSFLTRREVRVVHLHRDVTESDIKQRREIRNGTLIYEDQPAVSAAKEGQLLVLEGLERVERNVLPVINNLLENREMHLDNGSSLIHPARYDALLRDAPPGTDARQQLRDMGLIRVSEKFRVIGITVPVPPYEGNPLDPPLRSRFQCLHVDTPLPSNMTGRGSSSVLLATNGTTSAGEAERKWGQDRAEPVVQLLTAIEAVNNATDNFTEPGASGNSSSAASGASSSALQNIGNFELGLITQQLHHFPDAPVGELLTRSFPWFIYASQLPHGGDPQSGVGMEEARRRMAQYTGLLGQCNVSMPLLHSNGDAYGNNNGNGASNNRRQSKSPTSPSNSSLQRMGNVLRGMMNGDGDGVSEARAFLRSAQLVGQTADETPSSPSSLSHVSIPSAVEQTCNYVVRIEGMRRVPVISKTANAGSANNEEEDGAARTMVIADAVVSTATHKDGVAGAGPGTYKLPIFMGSDVAEHTTPIQTCPSAAGSAVITTEHYHVLQCMLQLHATRRHVCLLGPTGCGKTALIREFGRMLGYQAETMHLYADLTSKDLFQRRTTDPQSGNTTWTNAALVDAAIHGGLVILDGIDKLPSGMLASLQPILVDQSASLFDGTVLKPPSEYELLKDKLATVDPFTGRVLYRPTDADMQERKIFPIHPAFRVIATARPPGGSHASGSKGAGGRPFAITHDVTTLFSMVSMPDANEATLTPVLTQVALEELEAMTESGLIAAAEKTQRLVAAKSTIHQLLQLRATLMRLREADSKIPQLSFRQALHLSRAAVRYPAGVAPSVSSALLLPLMTGVAATQVKHALEQCGLHDGTEGSAKRRRHEVLALRAPSSSPTERVFESDGVPIVRLTRVYTPAELALVPFVTGFFVNPIHESLIAWLGRQYATGSNILLIGNQGVGKNKVVDAFLSRIQVPRHYLQLHRDTTVGSLTLNPTVDGGKVRWEDSPLVKAVQLGHCLVVDEIDKASVEVVQILKGLIEDREMRLGDGRRILDPKLMASYAQGNSSPASDCIAIHPDFRIIVLANPPGFPFHGNDFFRECGDLFSPFVMGNPDLESQLRVLKAYAPAVPEVLLTRLVFAFQQLQAAFEQGALTYPFSLRELIAVVKHLSRYPQDGVYTALNNVFSFDYKDDNTLRQVRQVLHHHLNPLVAAGGMSRLLPWEAGEPRPLRSQPDLLSIPFPKQRDSKDGADGEVFSEELPSQVLMRGDQIQQAMQGKALPAACWRVQFPLTAFAISEDDEAHSGTSSFTEWVSRVRMPFINRQTDSVIAMLPVGSHSSRSSSLLTFVIRRTDQQRGSSEQLILATARLPPSIVDNEDAHQVALLSTVGDDWQVGEVHFMDITKAVQSAFGAAALSEDTMILTEDFNVANHANTFMHRHGDQRSTTWPPSASARGGRGGALLRSSGLDDMDENAPLVVSVRIPSKSGSLCLLVDVSASAAYSGGGDRGATIRVKANSESAGAGKESTSSDLSSTFIVSEAALPINLPAVAQLPSSPSPSTSSSLHTRAASGIICYAQSNTLALLIRDCIMVVTMPHRVEAINFFTEQLALVSMLTRDKDAAEQAEKGILKIAFSDDDSGTAYSVSYAALPRGLDGEFVSVAETSSSNKSHHRTIRLSSADLVGAVWVPASSSSSSSSDIAFMQLEGADASTGLQFRVYQRPPQHAAKGGRIASDNDGRQLFHSAPAQGGGTAPSTLITAVDTSERTARTFAPLRTSASPASHVAVHSGRRTLLAYDRSSQEVTVGDADSTRLQQRYAAWSSLLDGSVATVGADAAGAAEGKDYRMEYSTPRKQPSGTLKHGEVDDKEHHGGNTWAGGTGGTDTAGLGGIIGPYRLDKGNPVHQVSPEEKKKVPQHIIDEAKRMGKEALKERLASIGMTEEEYASYKRLQDRVRPSVSQLRTILMGLKAAEGERSWLKGQTDGIWDDRKLVEGIVGDKNVFKRRVDSKEENPFQQKHKKRILFVLDVSASMYRFESMDHRLTKLLESTIMVMEAFAGFEDKIDYSMIGHNGDSDCIPLVSFGAPPGNHKERMTVCQKMIAYAQYCWSGDNTVEAMRRSIELVTAAKGDAYFVFVISDANLRQYGITPQELTQIMRSHREVQMFCIFIATLGQQSSQLQKQLPVGHGYECMRTDALPHILRQIFTSINLL